tara:strand:+ start:337 stop:585 length:249 start_codon:yes stop_codon:yes gene_type:complete
MLYYIYYGYVAGVTAYKLYEYWEIAKVAYTTCNYTYIAVNGVYQWVKKTPELGIETTITKESEKSEDIELTDITVWDMCECG